MPNKISNERLIWIYTHMVRIREFEESVKRTFIEHPGVIRGHSHLGDGAEASIVGTLSTRNEKDLVMPSYRCHGYPIVLGTPMRAMMELSSESNSLPGLLCSGRIPQPLTPLRLPFRKVRTPSQPKRRMTQLLPPPLLR